MRERADLEIATLRARLDERNKRIEELETELQSLKSEGGLRGEYHRLLTKHKLLRMTLIDVWALSAKALEDGHE